MANGKLYQRVFILFALGGGLVISDALAQDSADLRMRVKVLEDYVEKFKPSLDEFSQDLLNNIDRRIQVATDKIVVLNPVSRRFVKIEASAGTFLIAVQKMEKIERGYRLVLNIGNPNTPTYSGVKLTLRWGKKWDESFAHSSYEQWRSSLTGAEYTYVGALEPGVWTEVAVDLVPADEKQFEHIECEIEVNTVKLQKVY